MAETSFNNADHQNDQNSSRTGRRGFLKAGATMSAAFLAAPTLAPSDSNANAKDRATFLKANTKQRILGSGKWP
jgi:hypothetical protein